MANRTLLNEAIAEAESIREAALANAKAALEESFAPHIKELFSKKVQEMDKEEKKEVKEMKGKDHDKEELDEMDAPSFDRKSGPSITPAPEKVGKTTVQEEDEVELDALLAQLDEEMDKEKEDVKEGYDKEEIDEAEDHDDDKKMDEMEAKEDEKHLKEEEAEVEDAEAEVEMGDDPEIDLEEMTEEELMDLIRDVIDELEEKGEIEADGGEEAEEEGEIEIEDDMMEAKEEVEEGVGKWKVRKEAKDEEEMNEVGKWKIKKESEELDEAKHEDDDKAMEEALAEINKLKADLQEVNLLNAKLLYSNKIFREKNLSESQKVKVLESFDKANTAKEAKLIFETLSEGITTRERRRPASRAVKGSASKATNVIKENKQPIVESNDMIARFQKLAGIK